MEDEGLCRLGFSTLVGKLDLGTDSQSFGFGGTGKKSNNRHFDPYGRPYGMGDVIGCLLDLVEMTVSYSLNGQYLGIAFNIPSNLQGQAFYPAVCLKNAEVSVNFGDTDFLYHPSMGFVGLSQVCCLYRSTCSKAGGTKSEDLHRPSVNSAHCLYLCIGCRPQRLLFELPTSMRSLPLVLLQTGDHCASS